MLDECVLPKVSIARQDPQLDLDRGVYLLFVECFPLKKKKSKEF